jgi:peptidoglycan/LPS O-acetylase OafA/YrhL
MREQIIDKSGMEAAAQSEGGASRSPSSKDAQAKRLGILDDCRGFAIILVFLCHCSSSLPANLQSAFDRPWGFVWSALTGKVDPQTVIAFLAFFPFHLGWTALPIFFVVSGFCIHLTYCQPARPGFRAFYIRRFFRIYPPYLFGLLFFAVIFPWTRLPFNKLTHWGQFVTHLLMCHNVSELSVCAINTSYWTLAVEVQLYLLFPLLMLYVRRSSYGRALLLLAILEVALRAVSSFAFDIPGHFAPAFLRASPFFYCFSWATGAALADAYLTGKPLPFSKVHPLIWLVLGVLTSSYPTTAYSFPFFALATVSFLSRRLGREVTKERQSMLGRYLRATGIYSYSIYLIHTPILLGLIQWCEARIPGLDKNPFLIFGIGAITWPAFFLMGALMYHWVEKPSIALGKKLLRSWSKRTESRVVFANQAAG